MGNDLAGLGWEGGPCGGGEQAHPPLTWSCMMQLDSAAAAPPKQAGSTQWHPAASIAAQRPASQPATERATRNTKHSTTPHTHCPRYPTSWFVRCESCASRIRSVPLMRQRADKFAPMGEIASGHRKCMCVSETDWPRLWVSYSPALGCTPSTYVHMHFYFTTASHISSASSYGRERDVPLISVNHMSGPCITAH